MNYDTTGNQNYQGLQNPSSSYSNNQNPSSSYLKNQNPKSAPTRVAQAKTAASKVKMPTDKEILEILFPGEMSNIEVLKYRKVPSKLVRKFDFDAWTNSPKTIYAQEKRKPNGRKGLDGFVRIFTLYHEGLHIQQFVKEGPPKLFQNMLKAEVQAYGKAVAWLDTKQADTLRIQTGMKEADFRMLINSQRDNSKKVFQVANNAVETHILMLNDGLSEAEIDKEIYLEEMILSNVRENTFKKNEVLEINLLPNKYVDKEETIRYTIFDLYNETNKTFYPLDVEE